MSATSPSGQVWVSHRETMWSDLYTHRVNSYRDHSQQEKVGLHYSQYIYVPPVPTPCQLPAPGAKSGSATERTCGQISSHRVNSYRDHSQLEKVGLQYSQYIYVPPVPTPCQLPAPGARSGSATERTRGQISTHTW